MPLPLIKPHLASCCNCGETQLLSDMVDNSVAGIYCRACNQDFQLLMYKNHLKYDLGFPDIDDAVTKNKRDKYYQYKFVTFTLDNNHADVTHDQAMVKIKALANSKSVPVKAYYGCLEHTKQGRIHYHVIFDIPPSPKVSKRGFSKNHIGKFWKYGNIDAQNVQIPYPQNINKILIYIEKTKHKTNFFGNKRHFLCLTEKDVMAPGEEYVNGDQPPMLQLETDHTQ